MSGKKFVSLGVVMFVLSLVVLSGCAPVEATTEVPMVPTNTQEPPADEPAATETVEPVETESPGAGGGIVQVAYAWYGHVVGLSAGSQYDDYLVVYPEGSIEIGIEGETQAIQDQIIALRDHPEPNRNAHFWGTVTCPVPDYGECQLLVSHLRVDGPGPLAEAVMVDGWEGMIHSARTMPGSGGDDYFLLDGDFSVEYGIVSGIGPSGERELQSQIESLRNTGTKIRIWGSLTAGIPDWNGTQIEVSRIEVVGEPPVVNDQSVVAWYGRVASLPAAGQYNDYVIIYPEGTVEIGIEGETPEVEAQIVALRDKPEPSRNAHFWGTLVCPALDYGGCQLRVSRLRTDGPGPLFDADTVEGWIGTIETGLREPGSGGDDYFLLEGDFGFQYGIVAAIGPSGERELEPQIESLRDSGTRVRIWGSLIAGIPDWNGTQIEVTRLEIVP